MSTSAPPNKVFRWAFGLVAAGLVVGILVLALLVTTSGPRVRDVVVQNESDYGIASVNQGLTLVFDRPVEGDDFESAIGIQPETDYTVSHRNQQLSITFDQNLLSNTDYILTLDPGLEDNLGEHMEDEYSYEFTTAEPSYTYLERNYGTGAVDRIIERAPLSGESRVLFGADRIERFDRNDRHMAVVLPRADDTDELRVVDLATREDRPVDIPPGSRVDNLLFSPVDDQFVFVARVFSGADGDYSEFDEGESPLKMYGNNDLYHYDVDGEQLQSIDASSEGVESASYSRDGQALLYRTLDGAYYLTGAAAGEASTEPALLGKYGNSGGFDRTNARIAFQAGSGVTIYDARSRELRELPDINVGGRISIPTFLHNSDELLYLKDPLGGEADDTLEVYVAGLDSEPEEQVVELQPPARFFDEPVVSHDDRYVLIEATFDGSQGRDDYAGNPQPKDARLVLYDRFDREVVDSDTRGIDPVWNR